MTPHEHTRRSQSLALRDSLLGSSFSFLTVAVAVLLAASLRPSPGTMTPEIAPPFDPRVFTDYVPLPDAGGGARPSVAPAEAGGLPLPVDELRPHDQDLAPAEFPTDDLLGRDPGPGGPDGPVGSGTGTGAATGPGARPSAARRLDRA